MSLSVAYADGVSVAARIHVGFFDEEAAARKNSFISDRPLDCDQFIERGMFICGGPETVPPDARALPKYIGINVLVAMIANR
jgi:hypothetical protein